MKTNYLHLLPNLLRPSHLRVLLNDALKMRKRQAADTNSSLQASMDWLLQSHIHAPDGGSSAGYSLLEGWLPSYPETTGYIIPTFWKYSGMTQNRQKQVQIQEAAIAMTDWEIEIQLKNGAVRGGWYGEDKIGRFSQTDLPVVFNTGMVLMGFAESYAYTGDERYRQAGIHAADWLTEQQEENGSWLKGASESTSNSAYSYYTMVAYAMTLFANISGAEHYSSVAQKHLDWVLSLQNENGFYRYMSFRKGSAPYLHTIAYTIQGMLEGGIHTGREDYIRSAEKAAFQLMKRFEISGQLWGEYNEEWKAVRKYWCVSGIAQMAAVWFRLYLHTGDIRYMNAALKANDAIKSIQPDGTASFLNGGVQGSYPVWERYARLYFPNWAAKFYADALMLEQEAWQYFEHTDGNSTFH